MKDRTPRYPGRVKLNPVSGQVNVYDMSRADQPIEEGTPINKSTLLTDETAHLLELKVDNPTPDDAFSHIARNFTGDGGTNINLLEEAIHMKYCKVLTTEEPSSDVAAFFSNSILQTGYESDNGMVQVLACIDRAVSNQLKIRIINKSTGKVFNSTVQLNDDVYKYSMNGGTTPGSGITANFSGWFHIVPVKNRSNEVMLKLCGDLQRTALYENNGSNTVYQHINRMRMVHILDVTTGVVKAHAYACSADNSTNNLMSNCFPLGLDNNDYCYYNSTYGYYYTPLVRSLSGSYYTAGALFYLQSGCNYEVSSTGSFSQSGTCGFITSNTTSNGYMGASYYSSSDYAGRCFSWYMPISNSTGISFTYDSYYNYMYVYSVSQTAYNSFSKTTIYNSTTFYGFSNAGWSQGASGDYGLRIYILQTSDNKLYLFAGGVRHSSHAGYSANEHYCIMRFGPFSTSTSASNPPVATVIKGFPSSNTSGYTDYRMFNIIGCLNGNPDKLVYAIIPFNSSIVGGYGGTTSTVAVDIDGKGYYLMLPSVMAGQSSTGSSRAYLYYRYDGIGNPWAKAYTLPTCWYNNHLTKMFSCDMRRQVFIGDFATQQYVDKTGTWVCPEDGTYKIIMVGGGAPGSSVAGGGSGYLKIVTRACVEGEEITYHIGRGGYNDHGTSNPYTVDPPSSVTWFGSTDTFAAGGACSLGGANGYPAADGGGGGGYDLVNYGGNGQLAANVPLRNGGQGVMSAIGYGAGGSANGDGKDGVIVIVR